MAEKQVLIEVNEDVWAKVKSQAALEMKTLKEWLDETLREKLNRVR